MKSQVLSAYSIAVALSVGWVACSSAPVAQVATLAKIPDELGIHLDMDRHVLSNGLTVILVEDRSTPVVSYQTWFKVGSVDEHVGTTGMAHLFEHLMFKGTLKYGPKKFFEKLEARGAEVNAYTTRDYTVYHESFTPQLIDQVIDMESDRMTGLVLDADTVNIERQVVLEERRMRTDNSPGGKMQEALWSLAYRVHPYQWPVIGYSEDVIKVPLETVRKFYGDFYQPSNATLVVVGNFDKKVVFWKIQAAYSSIKGALRPKREIPKEPQQTGERRIVLYDNVASGRLSLAYHVTDADSDDTYALDVLANILFAGTSGRGYRSLVDGSELVTSVGGSAFTPTFPGLFIITSTPRAAIRSEEVEKGIESLIQEVQKSGVTREEVQVAVRQLTVQMVDSVRTPHGLAQLIGTVTTVLGDPSRFSEDLAKYTKVTVGDVQRVARKYLVPDNRSVVTLLPKLQAEKVSP